MLMQIDWSVVQCLWLQLFGGVIFILLLLWLLILMGFDDGVVCNFGLVLFLVCFGVLMLVIVISVLLVNVVGIIGFIGLFVLLLVKMFGVCWLLVWLLLVVLIGVLFLWFFDQVIFWLSWVWWEVFIGLVIVLIGVLLLLWLLLWLCSISVLVMNGGDNVQFECYYV